MPRIETVTGDALTAGHLVAVRRLLDRAFDGEFSDDDWWHAIGGHHVTVYHDEALVAHASVVRRRLWVGGNAHEAGYVEAVATEPDAQGRGFGTAAMEEIGRVIDRHHAFGVLSTGTYRFYERLGWRRWCGPTSVRLASGEIVRTPDDDGGVMVRSTVPLDIDATITCDERTGDAW